MVQFFNIRYSSSVKRFKTIAYTLTYYLHYLNNEGLFSLPDDCIQIQIGRFVLNVAIYKSKCMKVKSLKPVLKNIYLKIDLIIMADAEHGSNLQTHTQLQAP